MHFNISYVHKLFPNKFFTFVDKVGKNLWRQESYMDFVKEKICFKVLLEESNHF